MIDFKAELKKKAFRAYSLIEKNNYECAGDVIFQVVSVPDAISICKNAVEENKEAITFFNHLKMHPEIQNSKRFGGLPVCKICEKSSKQILVGEENAKR